MTPAEQVAAASETAYMRGSFSDQAWLALSKWLLKEGCTPVEAEVMLRSKHVRWACDFHGGKANSNTLRRYFKTNWVTTPKEEAQKLVAQSGTDYCQIAA